MRLDAIFEWALGALLIIAWPAGWFEFAGFEGWPAALVGAALIVAGVWIWFAPADRRTLQLLAVANGTGAGVFAAWLILWRDDFDAAGAALVSVTIVVLALLAVAESMLARDSATSPPDSDLRPPTSIP
jgi:hypothetical protein